MDGFRGIRGFKDDRIFIKSDCDRDGLLFSGVAILDGIFEEFVGYEADGCLGLVATTDGCTFQGRAWEECREIVAEEIS